MGDRKEQERVRKRISRGWSAEDAQNVPAGARVPNAVPITVNGVSYGSISECGRAFGVSHSTVLKWRAEGREFVPRVNVSALARKAGKLPTTVLRRVRNGMPLERALKLRVMARAA